MSEQSDVNNDIRFLKHTIEETQVKNQDEYSRLVEVFNRKDIQGQ